MESPLQVLVVDPTGSLAQDIVGLHASAFEVVHATVLEASQRGAGDGAVLVTNLVELARERLSRDPFAPVVLVAVYEDADFTTYAERIAPADLTRPLLERCIRHAFERARWRADVRRAEHRFRRILEGSPDPMLVQRRGVLLFVNQAATRYLGYRSAFELVGCPVGDVVHQDDLGGPWAKLREHVDHGLLQRAPECRFVRQDGRVVTAEIVAVPVALGAEQASAFILRDLTEERRLQAQLLLSERLASIGTLSAGVAHEINNPLAYVATNIAFVQEEIEVLLGSARAGRVAQEATARRLEGLKSALADVVDGVDRVRNIVRDLKTFSRADEDRRSEVDLVMVLRSALNMAAHEIRNKGRVVTSFAEVPRVQANAARLGQVFLNLLVNAAQALPEGDPSVHEVRVVTRTGDDGVAIVEVEDTGCGIAPEHIDRLFDPFFTTKPVGVGTGLGLSICHGIVAALDGRIDVESKLGKGTKFRVTLPVGADKAASSVQRVPSREDAIRARVLVVDDEPRVGASVKRVLGNHDVRCFIRARDALDVILGGEAFDIILCDLLMPEMNGVEFYRALEGTDAAARIVFMTGGAHHGKFDELLEGVSNAKLDKPIDVRALRDLIDRSVGASAQR